jgi:hypothetical protein
MEANLDTLVELLQRLNPSKDGWDIFSSLSVPILSFIALIITTIFSVKQWFIMKYEYRLKLFPERFELYKYLSDLLFELQSIDNIVGDKFKLSILKIEDKMFLYDKDIINEYQQFVSWINSNNITNSDSSQYTTQFKTKLSSLIDVMKKYFLKFHIKIA